MTDKPKLTKKDIEAQNAIMDYVDINHRIEEGDSYSRHRVADYGNEVWTCKACYPCLEIAKKYNIDMTGDC